MSLLVIGTVAYDAIETPFGKTEKILGGAATFISLAASHFVDTVHLVSVVGGDFEQTYLELFRSKGIDLKGLQIKPEEKTFFWSGRYHLDMNTRDTLETQLNVLSTFDPILPEEYRNCQYLMLGNLDPKIQQKIITQCRQRPKLIVMDTMNFWIENRLKDLLDTMQMVDVLSINDEEARLLSHEYSLVKAARKILTMGPQYLIIKKGEHGALLFNQDSQVFFAPALPLEEVFDPTGAGDSFAGGFIGYMAATDLITFDNMKKGIIYGSAIASFCVEKFGTERLISLTSDELQERIMEFIELVQFDISLD